MPLHLINNQTLQIAGTDITLDEPYIIVDEPQIRLVNSYQWKIRCMYQVYQTVAMWRADRIKNNIKTTLLYKKFMLFDYDERVDGKMQEHIDIQLKNDLVGNYGIPSANIVFIPLHL